MNLVLSALAAGGSFLKARFPAVQGFVAKNWKLLLIVLAVLLAFGGGWCAHGAQKPQMITQTKTVETKVVDEQEVQRRVDTEVQKRMAAESVKVNEHVVIQKVTQKDGTTVETTTKDIGVDKEKQSSSETQTQATTDSVINRVVQDTKTTETKTTPATKDWQVSLMVGVDFSKMQPIFGAEVQRHLFTVFGLPVSGGVFVMSNLTAGLVLSASF